MAELNDIRQELIAAIDLALDGKWKDAHARVQKFDGDMHACWIHAVLHRIEGDTTNAGYWYVRAGRQVEEKLTTIDELRAIRTQLIGSW